MAKTDALSRICLKELKETTKNFLHDIWCSGQYLNQESLQYNSEDVSLEATHCAHC
jgi:hypothetical protein